MSILIDQIVAFTIGGLALGCLYALVAFGYTMVFRVLRLFNFAHGGVFMVATIGALFVARWLRVNEGYASVHVVASVLAAAAAAIALGVGISVALEYGLYQPIRKRRGGGLPALVGGLGILSVMQEIIALTMGRDPIAVPVPLSGGELFRLFGGLIYARHVVVLSVSILVIVVMDRYVALSRMGRAIRAVGQDATTAALMGISVERVVVLGFALAGGTAGVAALLSNLYFGSTWWLVGFDFGIRGVTAALLGGMGSIMGALVGGLALGVLESYGGAVFGAQWQGVIAFVALVGLLLLRPRGIVGERSLVTRA